MDGPYPDTWAGYPNPPGLLLFGRRYVEVQWDGCMATERREISTGRLLRPCNQRELFGERAQSIEGWLVRLDRPLTNGHTISFMPGGRMRFVKGSALSYLSPIFAKIEFWL